MDKQIESRQRRKTERKQKNPKLYFVSRAAEHFETTLKKLSVYITAQHQCTFITSL